MKATKFGSLTCLLLLGLLGTAQAGNLRVLRVGLGTGTVTSDVTGISCGADCDEAYASGATVTLSATPDPDSTFVGWQSDCSGATCTLTMSADHAVKAVFAMSAPMPALTVADLTPAGLSAYLTANPQVDSPARFVAALPSDFHQDWIMMSRSESLQTGTAKTPRFLLPSENAQQVFTFGLMRHTSYPGADPYAIEFMQWDPADKNFHFHEIVLRHIDPLGQFPARDRGVSADDARCSRCHSTRNVRNPGPFPGTTGIPIGTVAWKNKPNWDTFASWGGMLPFDNDLIFRNSMEDAAFRQILNLWNWRADDRTRAFIEQLELQPPGVPAGDAITRVTSGPNEGNIVFAYDSTTPATATSPLPGVTYSFNSLAGTPPGSTVQQNGDHVNLLTSAVTGIRGRGGRFFDALGGSVAGAPNPIRVADEVARHRFATGSVPFDVRPLALAVAKSCIHFDASQNAITSTIPLTLNLAFFSARNGNVSASQLLADTNARQVSITMRKVNIEKFNLDRTGDVYIRDSADERGLIQEHGAVSAAGNDTSVERLRSEAFRRNRGVTPEDLTVMGGIFPDEELYLAGKTLALMRFFLEPLGVSVDKWSMGVRGRSRAYGFAQDFVFYLVQLEAAINADLATDPSPGLAGTDCVSLINKVNSQSASLPAADAVPPFTDVQRIFNKSCIECHGGLGYPPFDKFYPPDYINFSEDETNSAGSRLQRPYDYAIDFTSGNANPMSSYLYQRITMTSENCPFGLMPCGGPPLSKADIETIRRWIVGARPYTYGDPHLKTIDGTKYDFQSAGEFTLLRGEGLEIQTRQSPISTVGPLDADVHTGLSNCVSLNSAVALRVGPHRISYQPSDGGTQATNMQLRVDGRPVDMTSTGVVLAEGGRILPTTAGGIEIQYRGGTDVVITTDFWNLYQVWFLNVDVKQARATEGTMGAIAPQNWLPSMPDGTFLGPLPASLHQRYQDLYVKFANAWRVTNSNSLFDYPAGTSTASYSVPAWPIESPRACNAPALPGLPVHAPVRPLPIEQARSACATVENVDLRGNCEQDVHITGDPVFARAYLAAQRIQLNSVPRGPALASPAPDATGQPDNITFTWRPTSDRDGGRLAYQLCVWPSGVKHTFTACRAVPEQPPGVQTLQMAWPSLESGKPYFWKVVVDDGQGGTTESEMRRFRTR